MLNSRLKNQYSWKELTNNRLTMLNAAKGNLIMIRKTRILPKVLTSLICSRLIFPVKLQEPRQSERNENEIEVINQINPIVAQPSNS